MALFLDKLLALLVYPLGTSLLLALVAGALILLGRRFSAATVLLLACAWLGFWATPAASGWIQASLESRFPPRPVADTPAAEVIVVLGGGITPGPEGWLYPDLSAAADRYWHAARLHRAGKAPRILVSGGRLPWTGAGSSEAEAVAAFLADLGVPREAVALENGSRSTRENALASHRWLLEQGVSRIILVTSALHMPRALGCFRHLGLEVIPAASDHRVMPGPDHGLRYVPQAGALAESTAALHEYLGYWVYRFRGWMA